MIMKTEPAARIYHLLLPTSDGEFIACYSGEGLCSLKFPSAALRRKRAVGAARPPVQVRKWHAVARQALKCALAGQAPGRLPPLDLSAGTEFQRRVWRVLRSIRPGKTRSYAEVAREMGKAKTARAVGGACGANPIPVLVPCHRVLAANQRLGGFSGGRKWKRLLLAREGIELPG
jgi:O-6-methylguanine DNA methyltransferase